MSRPRLTALQIADLAECWQPLGFDVNGGHLHLGGVDIVLTNGPGEGMTGWSIAGIQPTDAIDGLPTTVAAADLEPSDAEHPNGALGLDHVVITTPNFDRTARVLDEHGLGLRRISEAGTFRQGFRRLGPAILELVENTSAPAGDPARFWGLVIIVDDLDALASRIAPHLSKPKPAVQPGRRIATLRATAGLSPAVAFMTPEPA